jgi:hypothetical protein
MRLNVDSKRFNYEKVAYSVRTSIVEYYLYCLVVAISLGIFVTSYTGKKATEILSFKSNDGNCKIGVEGVGNHCFGDFYYSLQFALAKNPWFDNFNMYPPVSNFFFKPFSMIRENIAIANLSLIFYYLICLCGIIFVIKDVATWYKLGKLEIAHISLFIFSSAPILAAIDRGNNQLFLLPLIYLFYKNCLLEHDKKAITIGLILVLLKPHFIFLGFYFLAYKSLKKFLIWNFLAGSLSLAAFLLYPSGLLTNFQTYVHKLSVFQNYIPSGTLEIPNLSLPNTIGVFERLLNILIHGSDLSLENRQYPGLVFTFVILLLALLAIRLGGKNETKLKTLLFSTLIPLSLPNVVFGYYLVGLLPFFLIYFAEYKGLGTFSKQSDLPSVGLNKFSSLLLFGILFFGFIPWQIPWSILPLSSNLDVGDISISWFLAQVSLGGLLISLIISNLFFGAKKLQKTKQTEISS